MTHYNTEGACRHDKRGGGVAFYINQDLSYMVRNDICVYNSNIEACFIELDNIHTTSVIV